MEEEKERQKVPNKNHFFIFFSFPSMSNITGDGRSFSSGNTGGGEEVQQQQDLLNHHLNSIASSTTTTTNSNGSTTQQVQQPPPVKKKRNLPGNPGLLQVFFLLLFL